MVSRLRAAQRDWQEACLPGPLETDWPLGWNDRRTWRRVGSVRLSPSRHPRRDHGQRDYAARRSLPLPAKRGVNY